VRLARVLVHFAIKLGFIVLLEPFSLFNVLQIHIVHWELLYKEVVQTILTAQLKLSA